MAIIDPLDMPMGKTIVDPFEKQPDVEAAKAVSTFEYIANQAKLGLTDSAVLGQAILDTFLIEPVTGLVTGKGKKGGIGERFSENVKRLQRTATQITGAQTGMKAPDTVSEIVGGGSRMMTDPINYIGVGPVMKTGAKLTDWAAQTLSNITGRAGGLFGLGVTAETGGIVGEQVEKAVTGETTGTGKAIGSLGGAVAGIPSAAVIEQTISGATNVAKQLYDKYKMVKTDPAAANEAYASGAAKRLLEKIAQDLPIDKKIDDIVTDFNRIGKIVNSATPAESKAYLDSLYTKYPDTPQGRTEALQEFEQWQSNQFKVPLLVAMSDNALVKSQVQKLAKENPQFRQRVDLELQNLATAIDERSDLLFGPRYAPVTGAAGIDIRNAYKRRQAIDDQIENLSSKFVPTEKQADIGKAIENLVEARRKTAAAEVSPLYQKVIKEATDAGATLPANEVENIYRFVELNNLRDIFGRNTPIDRQILSKLAPEKIDEQEVFKPLSFENVDSLKRAINEFQRERLTLDESRKINQLERFVNQSRQSITGDYSQRLADIDRQFYEKVGVPFSAQGIKDIDSKRYAEQVAPVIVKNSSSLNQFLNAVGDQGIPIANNAVISEVYSKAIKNDVLDPRALRSYIKQKETVLEQLPETRALLNQALIDDSVLKLARANIEDAVKVAEKRVADNFVISVKDSNGVSVPNYTEIANKLFSDPNFFAKITKDLKDLDPATSKAVYNSIRAEIVNKARDFPDGGLKFLSDPKNAKVINQVFGKGYQNAVRDLIKLSDGIRKANVDDISAVLMRAELDLVNKKLTELGIPGLDAPFITSTFRDRIASIPQKIVRLATRVNTAQLKDATDKAIGDLLLDKDGLDKLSNVAKTMDFKINNPASFRKVKDSLSSIAPRYMYGGTKEAIMENVEPQPAIQEPNLEFQLFEEQR